jgi:hypothetical protein
MYEHRTLDNGRLFIVLLVLTVLLNSTQAVVLCEGCDGHFAVELAGHHHCHDSKNCQHDSSDETDDDNTSCRVCMDTPLSSGILLNSSIQNTQTIMASLAGIIPSDPAMTDPGDENEIVTLTRTSFSSFYIPLSSIILIV